MTSSRLFQPLELGNVQLKHRVAMAPLTRFRADDDHVHQSRAVEYYSQRASVPGTLLITEGTFISSQGGGYANVPGIYNQDQIDAWKKVTDAVHAKGSFIYLQLWHLGRTADVNIAKKEGITIRSSSAKALSSEQAVPEEMKHDDIRHTVGEYAQAAKNAIAAGFDGVEVHAANGYLIDQFTQDTVNQRTDEYGGSVENRSRFVIEVTQAVVAAVGANRTGIRFSPFSEFQGMRMQDPIPQFGDIIRKLRPLKLSYMHLVESRISGNADVEPTAKLEPLLDLWDGPTLVAGGFKPDSAKRLVDEESAGRDIVAVFGRYFISNPDLVFRLQEDIELTAYNRDTFYLPKETRGYTDYEFSEEFKAANS